MLGNSRHHHGTLVKRRTSSLGAAALKGTWSWHYSKLQNLPWENPMVWAGLGHPFCRTIYGFITVFLAKRDHFGIQNHLFLKKTIETSQTPSLALLWPIFGTKIPPLCIASRSPGQPLRAQQFPPRMRQHWQHRETVCPALRDSWSREHFLCSHICHKCLRPCSFCQKNGRDMTSCKSVSFVHNHQRPGRWLGSVKLPRFWVLSSIPSIGPKREFVCK